MKHEPHSNDQSWENDAVWKLLAQASSPTAGPRFVDDTVRAARLLAQSEPWWKRIVSPFPLAALAGAMAVLAFALHFPITSQTPDVAMVVGNLEFSSEIQEIAETETLLAATDRLDQFSDNELVSLIGF